MQEEVQFHIIDDIMAGSEEGLSSDMRERTMAVSVQRKDTELSLLSVSTNLTLMFSTLTLAGLTKSVMSFCQNVFICHLMLLALSFFQMS